MFLFSFEFFNQPQSELKEVYACYYLKSVQQ